MGVNYSETIERMRWAGRLKNESAIARAVGVTPQALSNYKKRGSLPSDLVLRFAEAFGLSVDWIITGNGEMYRQTGTGPVAAEQSARYGAQPPTEEMAVAGLTTDELNYIEKLVHILRGPNKESSAAIMHTLDALVETSGKTAAADSE